LKEFLRNWIFIHQKPAHRNLMRRRIRLRFVAHDEFAAFDFDHFGQRRFGGKSTGERENCENKKTCHDLIIGPNLVAIRVA